MARRFNDHMMGWLSWFSWRFTFFRQGAPFLWSVDEQVIVESSELAIVSTEFYVPFLTESSLSFLLAGPGDVGRLEPCHPRTFGVG